MTFQFFEPEVILGISVLTLSVLQFLPTLCHSALNRLQSTYGRDFVFCSVLIISELAETAAHYYFSIIPEPLVPSLKISV